MNLADIKSFPSKQMATRNLVKEGWDKLSKLPFGKELFSYLVGRAAPYTGNIRATVVELRPGYAKVVVNERGSIRNHLRSIHAIALANLAELAGNIALSYVLPDDARFIVTKMDITYSKKARGTIFAIGECPIPTTSKRQEYIVPVKIINDKDEILCQATLHSLVGPKPQS
ncbi:MAG: DUF4442 domain-containing protein [Oligoflexus sp.]